MYEIEWLIENPIYFCIFLLNSQYSGELAGCITEKSIPITLEDGFCFANAMAQAPVPAPISSIDRGAWLVAVGEI